MNSGFEIHVSPKRLTLPHAAESLLIRSQGWRLGGIEPYMHQHCAESNRRGSYPRPTTATNRHP